MQDSDNSPNRQQPAAAPGQAPIGKTSPDGNVNRSEQQDVGNAKPGAQSNTAADRNTQGRHGGNHGNDSDNLNQQPASGENAKGSSNRGAQVPEANRNQGGGQDREEANQTKNTTAYNSEYSNAGSAPSSANDGGKIGDADNPA